MLLIAANAGDALLVQNLLAEATTADPAAPSFQVTQVEHLWRACAHLEQTTTDVILLDAWVLDSQGSETLSQLSQLAVCGPTVPVVVLSNTAESVLVRKAALQNAQFCLAKDQLHSQSLALAVRYALERQRFSAELAARKARLQSMVDRNADGLVVLTLEGVVQHVNPAAEHLFGRVEAELVGQPFGFPVQRGQRTEIDVMHRDGRAVTVEMEVAQTSWEGQLAYLVSLRDVTARKQAQEALRESEERYRLLAEHATDMISRHTPHGTYLYASPASQGLLGYQPAELVGRNFIDLCHPEDRAAIQEVHRHMLAQSTVNVVSYRLRRKDGTYVWFETTGKTVRDPKTQAVREFIAVSRDISERKRAEHALQQQAEELRRSNSELEQFAYVASHDLQEPLRMVTNYLQLLARRYQGHLDADADAFIAFAVDGAKRMRELINDLLAYSRVGTQGKSFQPTDCEAVLARALADLQLAIEESGAVITHDPLPMVMADASQVAQLLRNLLGNAIKFRSAAPPRLHIAARRMAPAAANTWQDSRDPEFEMLVSLADAWEDGGASAAGASETPDTWVFSIRDNGIGIDPVFAQRVFVIFQRLHHREDVPGTGIGLAVCKKIVERHGGHIWFESTPGQGTTFYFTLPTAEPWEA